MYINFSNVYMWIYVHVCRYMIAILLQKEKRKKEKDQQVGYSKTFTVIKKVNYGIISDLKCSNILKNMSV